MPGLGACGRGCAPVPSMPYGGEDCLSAAPVLLVLPVLPVLSVAEGSEVEGSEVEGSGAEGNEVNGPCEGTSSCGAETPQSSFPRHAGAKPRRRKNHDTGSSIKNVEDDRQRRKSKDPGSPIGAGDDGRLDARSEPGMTEGWIIDRGLSLTLFSVSNRFLSCLRFSFKVLLRVMSRTS